MKAKEFNNNFVVHELCRRVGLPYPPPEGVKYEVDAATWTPEEERDFRGWLKQYCSEIPKIKRRGEDWINSSLDWFIFQYSWKYKEEK